MIFNAIKVATDGFGRRPRDTEMLERPPPCEPLAVAQNLGHLLTLTLDVSNAAMNGLG